MSDAYLSLAKGATRYAARIGCLDRSTRSVYTVARCGCHVWGRNRVSGQRRLVTCEMRRWESDATGKARVIARDAMAVGRKGRHRTGGGRVDGNAA